MEQGEKANKGYPLFKVVTRLLKNTAREDGGLYGLFAVYTLTAGCYPFFAVALPKFVIGAITDGGENAVRTILLIALLYFLSSALFNYLKSFSDGHAQPRITMLRMEYVRKLFEKLLRSDYKYMEDATFFERNGKALDATGGNNNGIELMLHLLFETPAVVLTILALSAFIGLMDVLVLFGLILNIAATVWVSNRTHLYRYSLREPIVHAERRRDYYRRTAGDFAAGKDIRLYGLKERILANYDREIEAYTALIKKIAAREYALGFLGLFALLLSDALTYGILIHKTVNGMSIADFSMYIMAAASLSVLMKTLAENAAKLYSEGQYVYDYFEFLDTDLNPQSGTAEAVKDGTLRVEFKNMSFKYPGTERCIFKNLNLTVEKGEKLAVVGVNGAGKSTLVKLLMGLFDPTEGEILLNGLPTTAYARAALFSMFSAVFQEVNTFAYTLSENVSCSTKAVNEARVRSALKRAGLLEKAEGYEKGLDQMLLKVIDEHGTELSGGEAQKLAIARALYKNANMVVMDEPTAALDALAEAAVYENFNDLIENKTAIFISHRLASTKFCDRIAFFDGDGLKEYGTHAALMEKRGAYYEMFTVQGKYYNLDNGEAAHA
ncbi:MAG: ABC transporter ATP-binding protein/permease [Eubacteriales bacterium]|nr:ABC transporter ATP-binding protein/permease [Eubacteriales bacterium]